MGTSMTQYKLPSYIDFTDYSAMQHKSSDIGGDNVYDLAVVSQESSSLWIGKVEWSLQDGPNFEKSAESESKLYEFPKRGECETFFCNVEGVAFINNNQFV